MKLPQTILIKETNFANAWARAVRYVLRDGVQIVIGNTTEPKPIRDICATIELTGAAIKQVENRELHPRYPFRHIDPYCEEFTRKYLTDYIEKAAKARFSYLYFERLAMYGSSPHSRDQLRIMARILADQVYDRISSNRNQAITWELARDLGSTTPPCLQRIWVRHLGDLKVEVHLTWRSRDLFTAWQANVIAILDMLNREVIHPNNCRIVKLVDYSDSLHIYESDVATAADAKLVPATPQKQKE